MTFNMFFASPPGSSDSLPSPFGANAKTRQERRRFYRQQSLLPGRYAIGLLIDDRLLERDLIDVSLNGACFVLDHSDAFELHQEIPVRVWIEGDVAEVCLRFVHFRTEDGRRLASGRFVYPVEPEPDSDAIPENIAEIADEVLTGLGD